MEEGTNKRPRRRNRAHFNEENPFSMMLERGVVHSSPYVLSNFRARCQNSINHRSAMRSPFHSYNRVIPVEVSPDSPYNRGEGSYGMSTNQNIMVDLTSEYEDPIVINDSSPYDDLSLSTPQNGSNRLAKGDSHPKTALGEYFGGGYWKRKRQAKKNTSPRNDSNCNATIESPKTENKKCENVSNIRNNKEDTIDTGDVAAREEYEVVVAEDEAVEAEFARESNMSLPESHAARGQDKSEKRMSDGTMRTIAGSSEMQNREWFLSMFECSICQLSIKDITATFCGHIFCEECILEAIRVNSRCPICRRSLTEYDVHPLFF